MIIVGSQGHAKDIISDSVFYSSAEKMYIFDDITKNLPRQLYDKFSVLMSINEVLGLDKKHSFILALGNPIARKKLFHLFVNNGFKPSSFIASNALVSELSEIGKGLNIMPFSAVFAGSKIGNGSLINSFASIHHDVQLGDFVTISPGARILGRSKIGSQTEIGANACVLPDVIVGENVVVGAGAVVINNIPSGVTVAGVPARII